jgi:hypothetical protein
MGIAGLLFILGLILFLATGVRKAIIVGAVMACIGGVVSAPAESVGLAVYSQDTQYQRVDVVDGLYDDRPTRFFLQDHAPSGAMFLESDEFVLEIAKFTALYQVLHPDIRQALIIGGGAYNIPKKLLNDIPDIQVDVAETDPDASQFRIDRTFLSENASVAILKTAHRPILAIIAPIVSARS